MSSEAIVQIGTAVIALIGAIITYVIVPYFKSKTTIEQQKNIAFWVKIAVNGAEQIFEGSGMGKQKKDYVMSFLQSLGFKISDGQLDVLIEAAVNELNNAKEELTKD